MKQALPESTLRVVAYASNVRVSGWVEEILFLISQTPFKGPGF